MKESTEATKMAELNGERLARLHYPRFEEGYKSYNLKPCPFCGSTKTAIGEYEMPAGTRWSVLCTECMAEIYTGTDQTVGPVVERWNTRQEVTDNENGDMACR